MIAKVDRFVRHITRTANVAVVLSSIGLASLTWAQIVGDAPLPVQVLGLPIGAALGLVLVHLCSVVERWLDRRRSR